MDNDDCIEYRGARNAGGYGVLPKPVNGSRLAHRAALAEALGRPVAGHALHTCDNPPCINPAHLWEGSQRSNMQDAATKGRTAGRFSDVTQCVHEHPLTGENLILKPNPRVRGGVERVCRTCRTRRNQELAARRKAARHKRGLKYGQ